MGGAGNYKITPIDDFNQFVAQTVQTELQKAEALRNRDAMQYRMPYIFNQQTNPDRKPGSDLPFTYLRRMAQLYPIARACINRRIRQITQLEWDITTIDSEADEGAYKTQIEVVKQWLKKPMGHKTRFREFLTVLIDDLLTLDAISFEMQKTRKGDFMHLIPVDPTTIILRVTETGATPEPPNVAYEQVILGQVVAQFDTSQMLYESMNPRSYSPYGVSPLESLILQIEAAIRGTVYNLDYFKENNVPEGFITLPEDMATSKDQVEQWQEWFDALLAGDRQMIHRLKILPNGSEYTAAKKPEDMAFEKFEMWILRQTCAMFDIQPQDIGITIDVNKATGEVQQGLGVQYGLMPLANFVKEILDVIVQEELGFTDLQFIWTNINPVDRKEEVEIAEKEIKMGAKSVDEYRIEQGLEPIGLGHYLVMGNQVVLVEDFLEGETTMNPSTQAQTLNGQPNQSDDESANNELSDEEMERYMIADLRKWKKCIISDIKAGRNIRKDFSSKYIPEDVNEYIMSQLPFTNTAEKAYVLFEKFLDPRVQAAYTMVEYADKLKGR